MASKAVTAADTAETREEAAEVPLLDSIASAIKKMVARGKERGYLTYDELNAALPQDQVSSEQLEDTMMMLSGLGINLIESEESEEPAEAEAEEGEAETRGNIDDDDIGRTDDPVRMYLREMGSVELLSREGEIAIAKRIEAGRDMMIGGICENPLSVRALLLWRDALNENKMLLRDIIDLDATYGSALVDEAEAEMAKVAAGAGEEGDAEGADGDRAEPPELEADERGRGKLDLAVGDGSAAEAGHARDFRRGRRGAQKDRQGPGAAHHGADQGRRTAARDRTALSEMQG